MHEFRLVIAVIEGPVGLTHRSRNVSSFEALVKTCSETHNLQRVQSSYLGHKRSSLCQVFLAETVETGTKVVYHLPQIPEILAGM